MNSSVSVKVLGCSGGVGGAELQTTSLLVGDKTLIDAGTGVATLSLEQLTQIEAIFITHAHLDHIAIAPLLIDSTSDCRTRPLQIYALPETLMALKNHIFNWQIWPDFSEITINGIHPLAWREIEVGKNYPLLDGGSITVGPADHQVTAASFLVHGAQKKLFFSGDTTYHPDIVSFIQDHSPIDHVILECAFSHKEMAIAKASKHLYSDQVRQFIEELGNKPDYYITHLKPSQRSIIMEEIIGQSLNDLRINRLFSYQTFSL